MRLRRSTLNVPGDRQDRVVSAIATNADVVMMDLEDSIPQAAKERARDTVAHMLQNHDFSGKIRCVRINEWGSRDGRLDASAALRAGADEIKMTKCESPQEIRELDELISEHERSHNLMPNSIEIGAMIESPLGVINAFAIFSTTRRLASVSLGAGDLASSLGVDRDTGRGALQMIYIKQKLVLCAHAAGIHWVLDTSIVPMPGQNLSDLALVLRGDCEDMKKMGFTGRSAVYEEHIDIINGAFSPSEEEVLFSRKVVERWQMEINAGKHTPIVVDGRHIDTGKVEKAMRVLELMECIQNKGRPSSWKV